MSEKWRPIPGFPLYEVSDLGRIRSLLWSEPRLLKPRPNASGHLRVVLKGGVDRQLHHLVLETFVGRCPPRMEARHLNGDAADNRLINLVWDTRSANMNDRLSHGDRKLTIRQIQEIKVLLALGSELKPLANAYGVHFAMISLIKLQKVYADVHLGD